MITPIEHGRRRRARCLELCICIRCGESTSGRILACDACAGDMRKYLNEKRRARRAAGLCARCKEPAQEGRAECMSHARQNREAVRRHHERKRQAEGAET